MHINAQTGRLLNRDQLDVTCFFISLFHAQHISDVNPLKPDDPYRGRTAPLTSKRCILYIYSTNLGTKYHMVVWLVIPVVSL